MDRFGSGDPADPVHVPIESESLLKKYDIPIDHLDFNYVDTCKNVKELEQILHVLQSGQEGYYSELIKSTEARLLSLNPNSKFLRKQVPVLTKFDLSKEEWNDLTNDVENWVNSMRKNDTELFTFKKSKDNYDDVPIRGMEKEIKKIIEKKPERIKSMDYEKWDKLDVDAEILKMDIKEEKMKKQIQKQIEEKEKLNTVVIKPDYMTAAELVYLSEQEKTKGNEFYQSGDYEEACNYYTNSLSFQPSVAVFNNRAITNIKINKFCEAINDCNEVLKLDMKNEKALLRKAVALKGLKKYEEAMLILQKLIEMNPNNKLAQNIMNLLLEETNVKNLMRFVRMSVTDETKDEKRRKGQKIEINEECMRHENSRNIIVPIPGTSYDKPPFYKVLNISKELEEKYLESCKKTQHPSDDKVIVLNELETNISNKEDKTKDISHKENENFNCKANNDNSGSGEPYILNLQNLSPYEFIKQWQIIKNDSTLIKLETVLRSIKPKYLLPVIGNKLDGQMLSLVLQCIKKHFMCAEDAELVTNILNEFSKLPRFDLVAMLLNKQEKQIASNIINFTSRCGYKVPTDIIKKLI